MNNSFLTEVFKLLTLNKKLPYYQAERRIDIFINFYLEEILNHFLQSKTIKFVAAEFPLKKKDDAKSTKVDYLCCDRIKREIYFIELKTDNSSFKTSQLEIYRENNDWEKCMVGFNIICSKNEKTKDKEKFKRLKKRIDKYKLLSNKSTNKKLKIVYILPSVSEEKRTNNKDLFFITYDDLKSFKPQKYPEEWDLFFKYIIKPGINN